jgi:hypothetical protein
MDMRALDLESVHEPRDVVGPDLHVVVLPGPVRLAVAAHVVVDDAEVPRELRRCQIEVEVPEAGPVDLDDRLAFAGDAIPEVDPVDFDPAFQSDLLRGSIIARCLTSTDAAPFSARS